MIIHRADMRDIVARLLAKLTRQNACGLMTDSKNLAQWLVWQEAHHPSEIDSGVCRAAIARDAWRFILS